jgi:hypothetical protein
MKSWKVEVQADSSRTWNSNQVRLTTERGAQDYGRDLFTRWAAVRAYRVVEVDEPATHEWVHGKGATRVPEQLPLPLAYAPQGQPVANDNTTTKRTPT